MSFIEEDWERVHLTESIHIEPATFPKSKEKPPAKIILIKSSKEKNEQDKALPF
jgi:hypothetical protein